MPDSLAESLNLILDRGDRLDVIRDRQSIFTTHVSVAVRGTLNRIVHETAHVIQVRLRAGKQQVGDFLALPCADPGLLFRA